MRYELLLESELATTRLATLFAKHLFPGTVIALNGTLGAGKTRFVQALATACEVREEVNSPTFVLCKEYHGSRGVIYHADAYRLRDDDEFLALGPEEWFQSSGWTLIEWAEKVRDCLPLEYLELELSVVGETARSAMLSPHGQRYADLVEKIATEFRASS